jgi:multidrug resistance efflux pump
MEKPGSTRIIHVLPEGTWVNAGDVVCELDASAFHDELQLQRIRFAQAQAWVEQAKSLLEVSEITLLEYQDGIYPQDLQLIRQYLQTCRIEAERAERTFIWSKETTAKGFRATAQMNADELAMHQAQIALREAEGMEIRLEKYTAPKLIKNLKAKIAAIRADKLAQEQAFELESDRLRKLEEMVANCTMRAPDAGIVVYANQPNRFGQIENPIQEGSTVRQGQPIFYLPDPNHMQVKAKVNESKVSLIQSGQPARIVIDAFPDRPLQGTVTEITPIPAPASGAFSDVRVYYAVVKIDSGGFKELRPGLSAEVSLLIDTRPHVTRVPIQSVRWIHEKSYVAVPTMPESRSQSAAKEPSWRWQPVVLGANSAAYFEVISGLKPGEKVHAHPETLTLPPPAATTVPKVAVTSPEPRG